ncbi:MAG: response regulator [Gemmatimonadota bacterium]|nr:response regulator [Gemmatimonadota bacterium]
MAHILVVDDDPQLRTMLERVLVQMGHKVTQAEDGLAALNTVGTRPFAIAFVDLFMPMIDGLEVIPKLLFQSPDTKIVAMSGGVYGGKGVSLLTVAERLGAARTLAKPFGIDDIERILRELLNGSAA